VIDPAVRIEDVDPAALAHLNAVLSRRDRQAKSTLTVLHEDGRVVRSSPPGVSDQDLAHPESLLARHGVDEVVLLDARGLDELSARLVELARQTDDQGVLLSRCRDAYLTSWAVQVFPPPGPSLWPPVQAVLDQVPDGDWVRVEAGEFALAAEVRGGRLVRITSDPPVHARVAIAVRGAVEDVDAVLLSDDPLAAMRARLVLEGEVVWG
jgi:hypothetical protein